MATTEATTGDAFPAVNAARELNLGVPEEFPVDPVSAEVATARELARELKEESEARMRAKAAATAAEAEKCNLGSTLMSALVVSGVVVAAIGVAFIVTKKLKNT